MLEIEKVAVVSHEMREVQRRGGTFHIHLRGFFSSITPHVAAAVIPPSATSSKTSSGVPIGVIERDEICGSSCQRFQRENEQKTLLTTSQILLANISPHAVPQIGARNP